MTVEYRQDDIEGYYAYCYFLYEVLKRQMGGTMNKYERERKKERDRDREKRRTELEISPHCGVQKVAKRKKTRIYSSPPLPYVCLCHVVQIVGTPVTNALAKRIMCA